LLLPPPVQTTAQGGRQLPPVETPRSQPLPAPSMPAERAPESEARPASPAPPPTVMPPPAVVAALPPTVAARPPSVVAPVVNLPPALAEPAPPPVAGHGFRAPVRGSLLAGYGPGPNGTQNDGINIAAPLGTPIVAVGDGVVKYAGNELRGFGNLILIKHPDGWISAYAHCETLLVKRDQQVRAGQEIAKVGATGDVGAPQLHFELRRGTRAVDPTNYLPPITTAATP
jgi:murein DD-endopeptidase MepM/ murein hydrolase activator NlpD